MTAHFLLQHVSHQFEQKSTASNIEYLLLRKSRATVYLVCLRNARIQALASAGGDGLHEGAAMHMAAC